MGADKKTIVQNTSLDAIGISAVGIGVTKLEAGGDMVSSLVLIGVGLVILGFKYFKRD